MSAWRERDGEGAELLGAGHGGTGLEFQQSGVLRQGDCKLRASMGYVVRPCLNQANEKASVRLEKIVLGCTE